jgi:hypothetical protein
MLNSDPAPIDDTGTDTTHDEAVNAVLRTGAPGALALAGIATAIVVAIWFAFYFLVYLPRAGAP